MTVTQKKLYQRIAQTLANAIANGQYSVGSRLPAERDLAEVFSVSRPTVREAMIALELQGLVEARHGSGLYVIAAPDAKQAPPELDVGAFELLEARAIFEGEAAAIAATVIDDETVASLDKVLAEMAAADPASPQALEADRTFHALIARATGNSVMELIFDTIWSLRERAPLSAYMFAEARREGVHPRVDEHRLIVEALRARDPSAARKAMRNHLQRVIVDLLSATETEEIRRTRHEIAERKGLLSKRLAI
jgi:DNA-binding FadR family transcriptional regulator